MPPPPNLRELGDAVFEATSPYSGDGLRNHCVRMFRLTSLLMDRDGLAFDRGLLWLLAMVHDLGLVTEEDEGKDYLQRSLALFRRVTRGVDLGGADPAVLAEVLLYNHRLVPVRGQSPEASCFRRATVVEHTRGHLRFGLPSDSVREVFADHPRADFDRVLLDFARRTLRREPATVVRGIFF